MDFGNIAMYAIIGVVVSASMYFMNKGANKEIESLDGITELRMNKFYQIVGYSSLIIFSGFIVAVIYINEMAFYIALIFVFLLFGGTGLACVLWYRNHKITFDDNSIIVHNWRNQVEEISWEEITAIKFRPIAGNIKITGLNKIVKVHQHLVGLKTFTQKMEEKTKWKARDLKLPF